MQDHKIEIKQVDLKDLDEKAVQILDEFLMNKDIIQTKEILAKQIQQSKFLQSLIGVMIFLFINTLTGIIRIPYIDEYELNYILLILCSGYIFYQYFGIIKLLNDEHRQNQLQDQVKDKELKKIFWVAYDVSQQSEQEKQSEQQQENKFEKYDLKENIIGAISLKSKSEDQDKNQEQNKIQDNQDNQYEVGDLYVFDRYTKQQMNKFNKNCKRVLVSQCLMDSVVNYCQQKNIKKIFALVDESYPQGIGFFKRVKFEQIQEKFRQIFKKVNGFQVEMDKVYMELDIKHYQFQQEYMQQDSQIQQNIQNDLKQNDLKENKKDQ
ncbi:Acyl-CoA N-acyltransferase [Pseudocohnilembus persalinus]|uniref:Acyl-CoA N-acyltransferase n=1 Tax=Pseudocohnilembus persalinus TaxID=266149 RepID=A0A0V0QKF0_PSEPJ|nr:Acyl-CoA N-acyltransferase [Pseudocohnilembus persalinus]|eukprot:KRX02699.1 Acyl-CoA N-acyltransferase [Pseudocohnilembus persalinus]